MAGFSIEQLIKIIIVIFVLAVVVLGVYVAFKNYIIPYFQNLGPSGKLLLSLLK